MRSLSWWVHGRSFCPVVRAGEEKPRSSWCDIAARQVAPVVLGEATMAGAPHHVAFVREFAWGMLKGGADIGDALRRHATYYSGRSRPAGSVPPDDATARVEREAENLFAAAEFSSVRRG